MLLSLPPSSWHSQWSARSGSRDSKAACSYRKRSAGHWVQIWSWSAEGNYYPLHATTYTHIQWSSSRQKVSPWAVYTDVTSYYSLMEARTRGWAKYHIFKIYPQLKKSTSVAEKWENFTSAIEPLQSQRTQVKRFQMKELDDVISGLEGEISELEASSLMLCIMFDNNIISLITLAIIIKINYYRRHLTGSQVRGRWLLTTASCLKRRLTLDQTSARNWKT